MNSLSKVAFILLLFLVPGVASADYTEVTRTEKSVGSSGSWVDIDVSAVVPAGATGVCGEMAVASGNRAMGSRANGSTDNRIDNVADNSHLWFCIGVDASQIFEGYCGDNAQCRWYIDGYWTSEAVFNTNGTDKSLAGTAAWTDIDISGDTTGTAVCAIFEKTTSSNDRDWGFRMNGSSDNRINQSDGDFGHNWGLVGVDGSEVLEGYIENTAVDFFLVGYMTDGCTANTNGVDISTGTTGSYLDLTALTSGAIGGAIEVVSTGQSLYDIRKNGLTHENYRKVGRHAWWIGPVDASFLVEAKIEATTVDMFEIAIFTATGGAPAPSGAVKEDIIWFTED